MIVGYFRMISAHSDEGELKIFNRSKIAKISQNIFLPTNTQELFISA
jgi:hypothetical protein